jgi:SAM-dependent methyltransferase
MPAQSDLRVPAILLPIVCALCLVLRLDAAFALASSALAIIAARLVPLPTIAKVAGSAAIPLVMLALLAVLPRPSPRPPYVLPSDAPPWVAAVERVAARYASPVSPRATERALFHWVRTKLLGDPVAKLVADLASGSLLDVGTGRGQLPLLLLNLGRVSRVRGVDWDARKIEAAARAAEGLDAAFVRGDARTAPLEPSDTVLMIDLLHYFTVEEQDAILDRAAAAVRPGGRILVREADADAGWRSVATLWEERLFTLLRVNLGERLRFRPARDLAARLEAAGLACEIRPAWAGTPFSNVLVVGRRPAADG